MGESEGNGGKAEEAIKGEVPKLQPIRKPLNITAIAVLGLFTLALFYTLYLARDFFLPVVLAWIVSLLLRPGVRLLTRLHIPQALGAALVLISALLLLVSGFALLSEPASRWIREAPQHTEKVEAKIRTLLRPAEKISKAAEKVEELTAGGESSTPKVELKKTGLMNQVWLRTKSVLYLVVETLILVYFFLAAGDVFLLKLIQVQPRLRDKKRAVEIAREASHGVSQYLLAMTTVNVFEGTAIGIGLWLLGMPNPLLWGALAAVANYVPYLGAMVAGSIVTLIALISFDSVGRALMAPAIYFGVNFTDNFIGPYVMGRRLVLNPVVVFLAVMFWGWLWGIAGVLLAVPITMTVKILCDHSETLAPFAEFLAARRTEPVKPNGTQDEALQAVAEA